MNQGRRQAKRSERRTRSERLRCAAQHYRLARYMAPRPARAANRLRPEEDRDRDLLTLIAEARVRGEKALERDAIGVLLGPYMLGVRTLVARRAHWMHLQRQDLEEIVSGVMERLVSTLAHKTDFGSAPFGAVVAINVEWTITDFCRVRMRQGAREELTSPEALVGVSAASIPARTPTPVEQADAVSAMLQPLSVREREIVFERYVMDLDAGEIATRRGMARPAVRKVCSRGLFKLRKVPGKADVTLSRSPSGLRVEETNEEP